MGTQSIIAYANNQIYIGTTCNFDGYPSGVGNILYHHYNSYHSNNRYHKAEILVNGGAISVLDKHCDCPVGHSFDTPHKNRTIYYHRDRDGDWDVCAPRVYNDLDQIDTFGKWAYLLLNGIWYVKYHKERTFVPLTDYLNPLTNKFENNPLCERIAPKRVSIIY